jgi:guanylate kinase
MNNHKGKLFIISGPSGVGKDTVIKGIIKIYPNFALIKSYTTRPKRLSNEVGNRIFVSVEKFKEMIKNNEFIEWAKVHNWYYGRSKEDVINALSNGKNIIIDVDVQGAITYKKYIPNLKSIFIKYENVSNFTRRLISNRPEITQEELSVRKRSLESEMKYEKQYDYSIINLENQQQKTIETVAKIIKDNIIKSN